MGRIRYINNYFKAHLDKNFWNETILSSAPDSPHKIFYVIRRNSSKAGLFSYYTYVLGHIKYAVDKGWIPIVDMQHYPNPYLDNKTLGGKNAWEYYFCQPCGNNVTLDEVYRSKNVVLSSGNIIEEMPTIGMGYFNNPDRINMWKTLSAKYAQCNETVNELVDLESKKQELNYETTLGVMLRGTDYLALKPKNHPKQPTIEEACNVIDNMLKKYNCNTLFISTEDGGILDKIIKRYGNMVKYCDVQRYNHNVEGYLSDVKFKRNNDAYQKGIDYIVPMCILSRCRYLFAGRTSGSVALPLLAPEPQISFFWDNGCY